jgi:hypothetical protein
MQLRDLIRMMGSAVLAGGSVYVLGPELLRQHWPVLSVPEACTLANPLAVMAGMGGACFSVSPLASRLAHWGRWGCSQFGSFRQRQHRFAANIPTVPPPAKPSRMRPGRASHSVAGGSAMNLQQHMTMVEQAIAGAFVNNGLPLHLCGSLQGPHTLTFGLRLYQPTQTNINKALKLSGAIEAAIVDSPARVYMDNGLIYVEVPSPTPVVVQGTTLHGHGLAVPLGMTARQTIAGIDFALNPHVLLVGPTNRGKTTAARLVAYHLAQQNSPRRARFIVSTFKPKDWQAFGHLAHTLAVITDPGEAEQMIAWLVDLMHQRTASGQDTPHLFVFLDDLLNLLGVVDVTKGLKQLASLGRAAGIHLIIGTQRLGETGSGGAAVTGNIPTRLVFGTADAQDAALFSGRGDSGAEKLGRYAGDALLINDGGAYRLAVGYVTDADLSHLRQGTRNARPWQRGTNSTAKETVEQAHPTSIPPATTGQPSVPARDQGVGFHVHSDFPTPLASGMTGTGRTLPDRPPTAEERQYLRRLYEETGSKRAALKIAYGGVVSEDGYTPKTRRWLNEGLTEVIA